MRYILNPYLPRPTYSKPDGTKTTLIMIADGAKVTTPFEIKNATDKAAAIAAEQLTPIST